MADRKRRPPKRKRALTPKACARCGDNVDRDPVTWSCWFCGGAICNRCGDQVGHCGHPEAEKAIRDTGGGTWEEQAAVAKRRLLGRRHKADVPQPQVSSGWLHAEALPRRQTALSVGADPTIRPWLRPDWKQRAGALASPRSRKR
jgi:hypothetical protein